jgi:hypothetical protein
MRISSGLGVGIGRVLRWTGFPISETRIAFWVAMIEGVR